MYATGNSDPLSASAGTSSTNNDYISKSGSLTINSDTTGMIMINTNDDDIHERNETFNVTLSMPTNAVFFGGLTILEVPVTIIDAEVAPSIILTDTSVTIGEDIGPAIINFSPFTCDPSGCIREL